MNQEISEIISNYLRNNKEQFNLKEFQSYIKNVSGTKIPYKTLLGILYDSTLVFPLNGNEFITRAGAFTGRWFGFRPSREEVQKGYFLFGHRAIPFVDFQYTPDEYTVYSNGKLIEGEPCEFSFNQAMDIYSLFGEGYTFSVLMNDKFNMGNSMRESIYVPPHNITLTAWSLEKIAGNQKFEYGDRILCRIIDWDSVIIEVQVKKAPQNLLLSEDAIEREEWYSHLEDALLLSFDTHGPMSSIESQLAVLFLENQEQLCIKNCGSIEECMFHTTKIGFQSFGVETRIWKKGQPVPFIGDWIKNKAESNVMLEEFKEFYSPMIVDSFLLDNIYAKIKHNKVFTIPELLEILLPFQSITSITSDKTLIKQLENRQNELERNYNQFVDYPIASIRRKSINLYIDILRLYMEIALSYIDFNEFSQTELVILSQIFANICKMLEELSNPAAIGSIPVDDFQISLEGMQFTFEEISGRLKSELQKLRYKGFSVIDLNKKQ